MTSAEMAAILANNVDDKIAYPFVIGLNFFRVVNAISLDLGSCAKNCNALFPMAASSRAA
jgi:hypothetical protein